MNIGLILSGAMAKGAYEIGALKAVSEHLQPNQIKYISASSIGALNAYAYAGGMLDESLGLWMGVNKTDNKLFLKSVITSAYVRETIKKLSTGTLTCEKFYVPVFNLKSRSNFYVDLADQPPELVEAYLNAAITVFPICDPVLIKGKFYYDGAVIDNIPVFPLLKHNLDYIICIYFDKINYVFESKYFDNKVIKLSFYDGSEILSKSLWIDRDSTESMINTGYIKAKMILDYVFAEGFDDVETVYRRIEQLNAANSIKQLRVTGDVAINNLNKIVRRLTKRKFIE